MAKVGIILGSDSDLPKIRECFEILEQFDIPFEIIISSAHRTPEQTKEWAGTAAKRGLKVIIAAAGGAAHLPGVVAAHTMLPVIGIPVETTLAGGLDSMLSIIQMPAGIPVAAMATGKAGGTNAALFAVSILALSDSTCAERLEKYRSELAEKVTARNEQLQKVGYKEYIKNSRG
ncbi:MAG TPA: 5-(carboxyamino)imidazole ribonucleotide mutase [Spirochaetota bacterium]|nr:5-(carboxyamino)imidazole ribonucleotide mutase [Spirochaetota bacterium]HOD13445.1 5-(carboxyamino)imidazole ribonucleotide mutase [Spirochaetota bacterium]HPN10589.1 5-(carboxyamino)imidazole ribonucleotide mutase [Spirochaetota bacterium]HQL83167.1 5-(carboxyamino)imidazole ribonucleotide mutase [Spirochaetota bacterium]